MLTANYILGEDKYVRLLLHSPHDEPFEILSASYELCLHGTVEDSGTALIDGHEIGAKLRPEKRDSYELTITYVVADTTRKVRVRLEVK